MANKCCICGAKLGFFSDEGHVPMHPELSVCGKCLENIQNLQIKIDDEDISKINISRNYLNQYLNNNTMSSDAINAINKLVGQSQIDEKRNIQYHKFKTTTGYNFEGYKIIEYKNIVSGEIVLGTGFFSELTSQVSDLFGTSSNTFKGKISMAKKMALENMISNAMEIGANAIIGIDFDIITFSNNMIAVSINGTAVVIKQTI